MALRMLLGASALCLTVGAASAADENFSFRSPTGNILCYGVSDANGSRASCFIKRMDSKIPKRPDDCAGEWGHEFTITDMSEMGERVCHSDWSYDESVPAMEYGEELKAGDVTCSSERSGVTCINSKGHGFEVARLRQDLF